MSFTANLAGDQIPNSPVALGVSAVTQANLEAETLNLNNFLVGGLDLNVSGNINANKIIQVPKFQGNINVKPFNLRKLM